MIPCGLRVPTLCPGTRGACCSANLCNFVSCTVVEYGEDVECVEQSKKRLKIPLILYCRGTHSSIQQSSSIKAKQIAINQQTYIWMWYCVLSLYSICLSTSKNNRWHGWFRTVGNRSSFRRRLSEINSDGLIDDRNIVQNIVFATSLIPPTLHNIFDICIL